jgi:hypothetical protein
MGHASQWLATGSKNLLFLIELLSAAFFDFGSSIHAIVEAVHTLFFFQASERFNNALFS